MYVGFVERGLAANQNAESPFLLFDILDGESGVRPKELDELLFINVNAQLFG
jgi:hypothetical protein